MNEENFRMRKAAYGLWALGVMAALPSNALGAPVYLSCAFVNASGRPQIFNFMLDKSSGTFGVFVPSSGSKRMEKGVFTGTKATLNEGTVAWEIDMQNQSVVRIKRMVNERDGAFCKAIDLKQSGFED